MKSRTRGRPREITIPESADTFEDTNGNLHWYHNDRLYSDIPHHIDRTKIPDGIYWEKSGNGYWYIFIADAAGNKKRQRSAGPTALLSDLFRIIEENQEIKRDTFRYIAKMFRESADFQGLARLTKDDYERCYKIVADYKTNQGGKLGDAPLKRWNKPMVQKLVDRLAMERGPSMANHVLRYTRRVFNWAGNRIANLPNPAQGVEQAKEKGEVRCPPTEVYTAVLEFARDHAATSTPYLWLAMELAYLCRLRRVEVATLTDANELETGLLSNRRKGSNDNITEWTPRLRAIWDAAKTLRVKKREKNRIPTPLRKDDAWIFITSNGGRLNESSLSTAFDRMINAAIKKGVVTESDRFSLHSLKHRGVTNTKGDKKQASGHKTDRMAAHYDHSIPIVKPAEDD